jgi:hypothetical protein
MIKLETIHIEEVRGIKKLDLDFHKETFAIYGPNGSGKSGIIDAIEFGLTGQMGRLTGRGTKGLSVAQHGPHVDKAKFPDAAFVTLKIFLTDLNRSVTMTRFIANPNKPAITPDDEEIRAVLAEVSDHPEITLSRREILRFILVEPAKRSEEIQALLKLEEIGEARKAINAALNKLTIGLNEAESLVRSRRAALQLHLQISTVKPEFVLEAANQRRTILNLPEIAELTKDTKLDDGLTSTGITTDFNKDSALRDIAALSEAEQQSSTLGTVEVAALLSDLARLSDDPALAEALQQRAFVEKGLSLVDSASCPLCDTPWPDIEHLREHLKAKLAKSEEAKNLQDELSKNAAQLSDKLVQFAGLLPAVAKLATATGEKEFAQCLTAWKVKLDDLKLNLLTIDKIRKLQTRLEGDWLGVPDEFATLLASLGEKVNAKPNQSATIDAQTFLTTAQVRLNDLRDVRRMHVAAVAAKSAGKLAYETYCSVIEEELNALYDEVQADFSMFYRALNGSDESKFTAKLTPSPSSLTLDVNFYERGLFPPAAYHSEGHQDGMGVCLYLTLMKRLFGNKFTLSLLDDVVMSVDSGHRYEFCKLLKAHFPNTQFIITTHDRLWSEQMKSAGLVTGKTSIAFYSWTIDTGPLVQSNDEIWDEIAAALAKGKVESASGALRRHLEYAMSLLADQLGARPQYRADATYELDEMLTSVLKRAKELWGKAAEAAKYWKNDIAEKEATERKQFLAACDASARVEQWAVNKLVHYNAWANFGKNDFEPVAKAFKELLECFRCKNCDGWIYVLPRGVNPQSLRCICTKIEFNLAQSAK